MFLTIIVNLYTVRVIWQVLGVDDYGVYNVVGGIVTMFAFLNSAMVASSQRFISFELGRGDTEKLHRVFCISVTVHFLLAIAVLLLAETIGLWFLNAKLNIPPDRITAANCVYQCSVISFIVGIASVPYNSCIVAHEHMKVYGYFGILEVLLKLAVVFLLMLIPFDKLITYAILVLVVSILMRFIYGIYCKRHFPECRYSYVSDHHLLRDMFSFAGWGFIGNIGLTVRDQGMNIVVNLFFNVAVNAAKGIASQVSAVVSGFAQNFLMALNPQITKLYAVGNIDRMLRLTFSGCKYAIFLLMIFIIPLFFAAGQILELWLGDVAPYTVGFLRLALASAIIDCAAGPLITAIQATGHIKKFQIVLASIMVLNLPLAWLWLTFDASPYIVAIVACATSLFAFIARLMLVHELIVFDYSNFIRIVVIRSLPTLIISSLISWAIYNNTPSTIGGVAVFCILSAIVSGIMIFTIGLQNNERASITEAILQKFSIVKNGHK